MKYLAALLLGVLAGIAMFFAGLYYNPFAAGATVSPLAVSGQNLMDLSYAAVPAESIAFTNDGESLIKQYPATIAVLWEPTVKYTWVSAVLLSDARGLPAGFGFKFSSESERTRLLTSDALVDSVWHIYLPDRGTLFVAETENYWAYIRDIVIPARWGSGKNWRGNWHRITTVGPNAIGTGRVAGASGEFAGIDGEAVEMLTARAYSALEGPVAMSGNLLVSMPAPGTDQQ